jgi:hypothetical protein
MPVSSLLFSCKLHFHVLHTFYLLFRPTVRLYGTEQLMADVFICYAQLLVFGALVIPMESTSCIDILVYSSTN